jgi:hypothetical protein
VVEEAFLRALPDDSHIRQLERIHRVAEEIRLEDCVIFERVVGVNRIVMELADGTAGALKSMTFFGVIEGK